MPSCITIRNEYPRLHGLAPPFTWGLYGIRQVSPSLGGPTRIVTTRERLRPGPPLFLAPAAYFPLRNVSPGSRSELILLPLTSYVPVGLTLPNGCPFWS